MNRRDNESHPRCGKCGAWCLWDGVNEQCNNPRCNTGFTPVAPKGVDGRQQSLLEEPLMIGPKCKTMGWYHDGSEDQAAHMDGRKPIECPDCVAYRERNES